jgi:DNA-damage-inducible protein D
MVENKALVVFQGEKIRRTGYNNEWWYVIKDIIYILTESINSSDYLKKLRKRIRSAKNK